MTKRIMNKLVLIKRNADVYKLYIHRKCLCLLNTHFWLYPSVMEANVYVLRHGETNWNKHLKHRVGGRSPETELTNFGTRQAIGSGLILREIGVTPDSAIYTPSVRSQASCRLALNALGFDLGTMNMSSPKYIDTMRSDGFSELSKGLVEGRLRVDIERIYGGEIDRYGLDFNFPGGESERQVGDRVHNEMIGAAEWTAAVSDGDEPYDILVFGHGIATAALIAKINDGSHEDVGAISAALDNGSATRFNVDAKAGTVELDESFFNVVYNDGALVHGTPLQQLI